MSRIILIAAALLLAPPLALGQDLKIEGSVKQVTIVSSVPFTVRAPEGAFDYRWVLSQGITGQDLGDTYVVGSAPGGACKITAIVRTIDFDAKKVTTKVLA